MRVKEKILKIMALCLEINPPEIENIGQKKTAVFFRWSPHCNVLVVEVHFGGWKSMRDADIKYDLYFNQLTPKTLDNELDGIIKVLEEILEGEKTNESI